MADDIRKVLKEIDDAVQRANEQKQPVLNRQLQMIANFIEGFAMTFAILGLTSVVLLPIYLLSADMRKALIFDGGIFSLFLYIAAFSAVWSLFFIWGLPKKYGSKTRRSVWLDWVVRGR